MISAALLAQERRPSISTHTSICGVQSSSRPRSWQIIQRRPAFISNTLSPHVQHVLDILLLGLIPVAQKRCSFFSLTMRATLGRAASVLSQCNNRLISSPHPSSKWRVPVLVKRIFSSDQSEVFFSHSSAWKREGVGEVAGKKMTERKKTHSWSSCEETLCPRLMKV